jgi:ParB/RepB/Spo0J family partition protein
MVVEGQVKQVPIKQVTPAPDNIRESVGDVVELSTSIAESGLVQPLIVRPLANGNFEVVAGARRLAAAELAGLDEIPVIVRDYTEEQRLVAMAVENLQREDLTPLEEARAYKRILELTGASQRDLAPRIGKTQPHISKRLALLELPKDVQKQVDAGGITIPDALELAKLAEHPERLKKALAHDQWTPLTARVRQQLDEIKRDEKIAKLEESIESKGYRTIRVTSEYQLPKGVHRLKGGSSYDAHALDITTAKHETQPCHAIAITRNADSFPVCTDRKNHPNAKTTQEKDRAARSSTGRAAPRLDPQTKKLHAAREERLQFVAGLVAKKPSKDALQFIAAAYVEGQIEYFEGELDRVAILLGAVDAPEDGSTILPDDVDAAERVREFAQRGAGETQRAALALALVDADNGELERVLRGNPPGSRYVRGRGLETIDPVMPRMYLELLRGQGYQLGDLETKVVAGGAVKDAA